MWVCLNDAFFSIIEDDLDPGVLIVRARVKGHIEKVFPKVKVTILPERDYRFRCSVDRETVAQAMATEVRRIDYHNFKDSVVDEELHDAYMSIWSVMFRLQAKLYGYKTAGKNWYKTYRDYGGKYSHQTVTLGHHKTKKV